MVILCLSPTFTEASCLIVVRLAPRKVRATKGSVLPNGKVSRAIGVTDSATENKLPRLVGEKVKR